MSSIYHCDIKGNNLVYDDYGNIKIIDFGSIVFNPNEYGKYGYTPDYNFFQFIKKEERVKFKELAFIFEMFSICKMINKL